jgi:hypothetical protein
LGRTLIVHLNHENGETAVFSGVIFWEFRNRWLYAYADRDRVIGLVNEHEIKYIEFND